MGFTFNDIWYDRNVELLRAVFYDCTLTMDNDEATWFRLSPFDLPPNFAQCVSDLLIFMPGVNRPITQFPDHFYLDEGLTAVSGGRPAHVFEKSSRAIPEKGYAWFCLHLDSWRPSRDVVSGDNLVTIANTIYHKLSEL